MKRYGKFTKKPLAMTVMELCANNLQSYITQHGIGPMNVQGGQRREIVECVRDYVCNAVPLEVKMLKRE